MPLRPKPPTLLRRALHLTGIRRLKALDPNAPNPVAGRVEDALIALGTTQAIAALIVEFPWMGLPIIRNILTAVIGYLVKLLVGKTAIGINTILIEVGGAAEVKQVQDTAKELQNLPEGASDEEIAKRRKAFEEAAARLISINTNRL